MSDQLAYFAAEELIEHYRSGALSPIEVIRALLDRIAAVNPKVNALYFADAEAALAAAAESEERWRRGNPQGLLDGVPVSLKDSVLAIGMPSYHGTLATDPAQARAPLDAPVTMRLKEAGAIIIGKTTMPDFGMIASGVSSRYGVTRNPWDLSRNSGGSSSASRRVRRAQRAFEECIHQRGHDRREAADGVERRGRDRGGQVAAGIAQRIIERSAHAQ